MLFDSFKKRIGNLIAINLATVIVITNPKTKAYELLGAFHSNGFSVVKLLISSNLFFVFHNDVVLQITCKISIVFL